MGNTLPPPSNYADKQYYRKGYNRGRFRTWETYRRVSDIAKRWRDLATKGSDKTRTCENCVRWHRDQPSHQWGICRAAFEYGVEPRMWADTPRGERREPSICTSKDFGCVNWNPKP